MKKTYNLGYEKGKYYLEYSMPKNDEGRLVIDEKKMELDSVKLYKIFFEKATESIEIIIDNKIDENNDEQVRKKGAGFARLFNLFATRFAKRLIRNASKINFMWLQFGCKNF